MALNILNNPERIKQTISRFYTGRAKIEIKKSVTDEGTHKTRPQVLTVYKSIPCRLSHDSKATSSAHPINNVSQTIELFTDNIYEIPAGAKITVTQDGVTNIYGCTGEPNVFETHQQIELELWEDWSGTRSKRSSQDV